MNKLLTVILVVLGIYFIYKIYRAFIYMKFSKKGRDFLIQLEGSKNKMYLDSKGLPTIGVGHLIKPGEEYLKTATLSDKEVSDLFEKDIKVWERAVNNAIFVPIKQHEFDSLVSVSFNIGAGWSDGVGKEATYVKLVNAMADKKDIVEAIMRFRYPSEIESRRAREARLFETGSYSTTITNQEVQKYLP